MKLVTVIGARPQFVKAALVSRQFGLFGELKEILVNTGQHYDPLMSDAFLRDLGMKKPDYNLEVGSGSHGAQTARILEGTEAILMRERPDAVVVYGDTNSTLGGALAAAKLHIPVVHVEAGLRSFNRRMPEELNRIVTDHLSDLLLAPNEEAAARLCREGIPTARIQVVGDIMYDALLAHLSEAGKSSIAALLGLKTREYVLCTVHRAENTDVPARLKNLLDAMTAVAREMPVVFPVHPRSRKAIESFGLNMNCGGRLKLIVGYFDMLALERGAAVIATDSGGVQKEAYFLQVPCVTLRNETEWSELISSGWNLLAPPDGSVNIAETILRSIGRRGYANTHFYGDGNAAVAICSAVRGLCDGSVSSPTRICA